MKTKLSRSVLVQIERTKVRMIQLRAAGAFKTDCMAFIVTLINTSCVYTQHLKCGREAPRISV